jgi:sarcosine oxidase
VQPDGGFVEVELALEAFVSQATAAGAVVRRHVSVRAIEPRAAGVRILTDEETTEAETVIVSAGAWTRSLLPTLPLHITREVTAWFEPTDANLVAPGRFPVFIIESPHGMHYGIPPHGGAGLKAAKHHHRGREVEPDAYDRTVSADDETLIRCALAEFVPSANGRMLAAKTCLYTMTPDGHFIIDRLPGAENVIVASACSGHGFKFAPVVGEILAELAVGTATRHDISRFRLARFG